MGEPAHRLFVDRRDERGQVGIAVSPQAQAAALEDGRLVGQAQRGSRRALGDRLDLCLGNAVDPAGTHLPGSHGQRVDERVGALRGELPVAAIDGFGSKARRPGDRVRAGVADGGDHLEALHTEVVASPAGEQRERAPRDAVPASRGAHPEPETPVRVHGIDAQQVDGADDLTGGGVVDGEVRVAAVAPGRRSLADPGHGVAETVGRRQGTPVADLGLAAGGDEGGGVVERPRTQHDLSVGQVRQPSCQRTLSPLVAGLGSTLPRPGVAGNRGGRGAGRPRPALAGARAFVRRRPPARWRRRSS